MAHVRMEPDARKNLILDAAIKVAAGKGGIKKATRTAIAAKAGVSVGLVSMYFGNKNELRDALVAHAVTVKNVPIVKDAIALGIKFDAPRQLMRDAQKAA